MIGLEAVYWLMGVLVGGIAVVSARDASNPRRWHNTTFWALWAFTFVASSHMPHFVTGLIVLAMVVVGGVLKLSQGTRESATREERTASAARWGNRLFIPALLIPAVTLFGNWAFNTSPVAALHLVEAKQVTQVSLGIATIVALIAGMAMLRPPAGAPVVEARRLLDSVGWAAVLPQMLAALGALFAVAGVGNVVATIAERWIPLNNPLVAVITYTAGMALFTMIMGNAFAAFPVMTAGIGLPIVMMRFGGDPVVIAAVGMLSGFCGTLMTPMAANYNIVPAALLELPDENAVIKAQLPTALILLAANTVIMYLFAFRR